MTSCFCSFLPCIIIWSLFSNSNPPVYFDPRILNFGFFPTPLFIRIPRSFDTWDYGKNRPNWETCSWNYFWYNKGYIEKCAHFEFVSSRITYSLSTWNIWNTVNTSATIGLRPHSHYAGFILYLITFVLDRHCIYTVSDESNTLRIFWSEITPLWKWYVLHYCWYRTTFELVWTHESDTSSPRRLSLSCNQLCSRASINFQTVTVAVKNSSKQKA